ncbi:MAG: hypothetical protein ACLRFE_04120 [Clostridia bacterium]
MTILDLIKKSAITLNIKEVIDCAELGSINFENEQEILNNNFALKRLFEFAKLVISEVSSYSPKVDEVELSSVDGKINIDSIHDLLKIIAIKNEYGYAKFIEQNNNIVVDDDGEYTIVYYKAPEVNSVLSKIEINKQLGEDLLLMGVNSYYCLATGLYAEYNIYNNQYVDRLSRIRNLKIFSMPCRSWHG